MNNLFKNSNGKFTRNLFKSLGIFCVLTATTACSNNEVNKVNRGSEKSVIGEPSLSLEEKEDKVEDDKKVEDESLVSGSVKKSDEQVSRSGYIRIDGEECEKELIALRAMGKGEYEYCIGKIRELQDLRYVGYRYIRWLEDDICSSRCFFFEKKQLILQLKWGSEAEKEKMLAKFESIQKSWEDGVEKDCLAKLERLRYEGQKISEKIKMFVNGVSRGGDLLSNGNFRLLGDLIFEENEFLISYQNCWCDIVNRVNGIIDKGENLKEKR